MAKEKRALSPEELKIKRKQNLYMGGGLVALLVVASVAASLTGTGRPNRPAAPETRAIALGGSASDKDAWRAHESTRIEVLEKSVKDLVASDRAKADLIKRLEAEAAARQALTPRAPQPSTPPAQAPPRPSPPPAGPATAPANYPPPPSQPFRQAGVVASPSAPVASAPVGPRLVLAQLTDAPRQADAPQDRAYRDGEAAARDGAQVDPAGGVQNFIPSGSFARAVLLNGVDAPTGGNAQSNPMPVLLELKDDAQLPNNFRSRLSGCFALGDAHGDISSERVLIRLNRLSCVDQDGGAVDLKVQGYIADETGRVGAQGTLISKTGQVLANALWSGILSGVGKGIRQDSIQSNTTITGAVTESVTNPWRAGIGEGVGKSFDRISDYYLKLADKLFPVVSIDPGRTVEIVFTKGVQIERK